MAKNVRREPDMSEQTKNKGKKLRYSTLSAIYYPIKFKHITILTNKIQKMFFFPKEN